MNGSSDLATECMAFPAGTDHWGGQWFSQFKNGIDSYELTSGHIVSNVTGFCAEKTTHSDEVRGAAES